MIAKIFRRVQDPRHLRFHKTALVLWTLSWVPVVGAGYVVVDTTKQIIAEAPKTFGADPLSIISDAHAPEARAVATVGLSVVFFGVSYALGSLAGAYWVAGLRHRPRSYGARLFNALRSYTRWAKPAP